jgi:hypothetical protein
VCWRVRLLYASVGGEPPVALQQAALARLCAWTSQEDLEVLTYLIRHRAGQVTQRCRSLMAAIPVGSVRPVKRAATLPLVTTLQVVFEWTCRVSVEAVVTSRASGQAQVVRLEPAGTLNDGQLPLRQIFPLWAEYHAGGQPVLADLDYVTGNGEKPQGVSVGLATSVRLRTWQRTDSLWPSRTTSGPRMSLSTPGTGSHARCRRGHVWHDTGRDRRGDRLRQRADPPHLPRSRHQQASGLHRYWWRYTMTAATNNPTPTAPPNMAGASHVSSRSISAWSTHVFRIRKDADPQAIADPMPNACLVFTTPPCRTHRRPVRRPAKCHAHAQ